MRRRLAATLLSSLALLAAPGAALAADCPRTTLGEVEKEVMCPVCGTPLELATEAPQAIRERRFIEQEIARCRSKEQIKRVLVSQFGEKVLALPGDEGEGGPGKVLVYVIPALALLAGAGAVGMAASRWRGRRRRPGPPDHTAARPPSDPLLEADMERYDL